jgi:hypothetical protein
MARSSPSSVEIKNSKATSTILQPTAKISFELARPPHLAQIIKLVPTSTNNHQTLYQSTSSTQNPNVNVRRLLTFFVRHHKNKLQTSSCQHHTSACTVPPSCQHNSNITNNPLHRHKHRHTTLILLSKVSRDQDSVTARAVVRCSQFNGDYSFLKQRTFKPDQCSMAIEHCQV